MRIPRIYQSCTIQVGDTIELEKPAAHHLTRVLRLNHHDPVILFNGDDSEYPAQLHIDNKKVFVTIEKQLTISRESSLQITLLQGISKGDRMDLAIQKAVELGVTKIIPVICQRTVVNLKAERKDKKMSHWQGIVINACEQSGRNKLPELEDTQALHQVINQNTSGLKLTLDPQATISLASIKPDTNQVTLLIGPEGGLTDEEIEQAKQQGISGIQLGKRVLRTETAALAAISAIQTLWGDFN